MLYLLTALVDVFHDAGCKLILSSRQAKVLEKLRDRLSYRMVRDNNEFV